MSYRPPSYAQVHEKRINQYGMTLIEVLVSLVVGSIAIIVIMNLFAITEDRKRVTTSGADAAINGQIAMTTLERDLRHAGLSMPGLTCPNIRIWVNGASASFMTLPVRILPDATDGGATPSTTTLASLQQQRIDIIYGNPADAFFNATIQTAMATSTAALHVDNGFGFRQGELVVVSELGGNKDCSVVQMTQDRTRLRVPNVTTTGTQ